MTEPKKRAIAAMSGGVDSSVAAYILKEQGYDPIGVTMKLYSGVLEEGSKTCCSADDAADARNVCFRLGIRHYVFNLTDMFKEKVIDYFVDSYLDGKTPNPCIECNRYLKFDKLIARAKELDFGYVATGHYAQIEYDSISGRYLMKKAVDASKDQTYFLYMLNQEQLSMILFPLGGMTKDEVRAIADAQGFANAQKPDSQDICFVTNGDYVSFIEDYIGKKLKPGNFVSTDGKILGKHKGQAAYTVGQRKGLGISAAYPLYVCKKSVKDNQVILGREQDLYSKSCILNNYNSIAYELDSSPRKVWAKIRYRHPEQPAHIRLIDENKVLLEFEQPQKSIAPGQAAVLYDGDYVVGGGEISANL